MTRRLAPPPRGRESGGPCRVSAVGQIVQLSTLMVLRPPGRVARLREGADHRSPVRESNDPNVRRSPSVDVKNQTAGRDRICCLRCTKQLPPAHRVISCLPAEHQQIHHRLPSRAAGRPPRPSSSPVSVVNVAGKMHHTSLGSMPSEALSKNADPAGIFGRPFSHPHPRA